MIRIAFFVPIFILSVGSGLCPAATSGSSVFPNESFDYKIAWPTGLDLGEAHWRATNTGTAQAPQWDYTLNFDVHFPGYALIDSFEAKSTAPFCTETFTRRQQHGARKFAQDIEVNAEAHTVKRITPEGGGESQFDVPDCVKDPLSLVVLARHELLSGRIPPAQRVLFGYLYDVSLTYVGQQDIKSGDKTVATDHVSCHIKGPASDRKADIYFARDAVRTPVRITIPLPLGAFSLELTH